MTKEESYITSIGYNILNNKTQSKITINGKCQTSLNYEMSFCSDNQTKIKQSFYPIFFEDNNRVEYISIEVGENT